MSKASPIQPLDSFCCGCSLDVGITLILTTHAVASFIFIFTTVSNIVLGIPTMGANVDLATQAFNCGFALAGLPFIVSGFSGIKFKHETHLRVYFFWSLFSFVLDGIFLCVDMVRNDCTDIPQMMMEAGGSFACGMMRVVTIASLFAYLSVAGYSLFAIWSRCLELQCARPTEILGGLLRQGLPQPRNAMLHPQRREGLFGTGPPPCDAVPVVYGSLASPAIGGSARIFGGERHELRFPPPP